MKAAVVHTVNPISTFNAITPGGVGFPHCHAGRINRRRGYPKPPIVYGENRRLISHLPLQVV